MYLIKCIHEVAHFDENITLGQGVTHLLTNYLNDAKANPFLGQ